jgi:hypothetical protein
MTIKFTDEDRNLVIKEIEKFLNVRLEQVKPSRKLFRDLAGTYYLISGGTGNWHGITINILNILDNYDKDGKFIIVKKLESEMNIYFGSLRTFLENKVKLNLTTKGQRQFHCEFNGDTLYLKEIEELQCRKVFKIPLSSYEGNVKVPKVVSKIINTKPQEELKISHYDLQAKLVLIGNYLGYRTFVPVPDKGKNTFFGSLGDLCSEDSLPEGSIPGLSLDTVKFVDVIWFDDEGYPTHAFEVEHTTDITKGLLRLYQLHKLRIKMFIISEEDNKRKFKREVSKSPFSAIKKEFIFKNYDELDEFFQLVKEFSQMQEKFLA